MTKHQLLTPTGNHSISCMKLGACHSVPRLWLRWDRLCVLYVTDCILFSCHRNWAIGTEERRVGERSTVCEATIISNLPPASISSLFLSCSLAKHEKNIISSPSSLGENHCKNSKTATMESLAALINIYIGNVRAATKAVYLFIFFMIYFLRLLNILLLDSPDSSHSHQSYRRGRQSHLYMIRSND